jgi:ribonucleoside-diphosphate reductase alpha chain
MSSVANPAASEGTVVGAVEKAQAPTVESADQKELFICAFREKLPNERNSVTHRFSVGGQEGYIIVGMYKDGRPGEVFIKMAKEGSTLSGVMDGLALSLSIGLQYGVPLKVLVAKLINMRFEPCGITENPEIRFASSLLDYVGRWLGGKFISQDYLKLGTGRNLSQQTVPGPAADRP